MGYCRRALGCWQRPGKDQEAAMDRPWWSANRHVGWTRIGWTRAAGPLLCGLLLLSSCALSLPWPGGASAPHRGGSVVVSLGDTASLIPSQMQMDFEWAVD